MAYDSGFLIAGPGAWTNAVPRDPRSQPIRQPFVFEIAERNSSPRLVAALGSELCDRVDRYYTWLDRKAALDSACWDPGTASFRMDADRARKVFAEKYPCPAQPSDSELQRYNQLKNTFANESKPVVQPAKMNSTPPVAAPVVAPATFDPSRLASYRAKAAQEAKDQANLRYYQSMGFKGTIDDLRKQEAAAKAQFAFLR